MSKRITYSKTKQEESFTYEEDGISIKLPEIIMIIISLLQLIATIIQIILSQNAN